MIPLYHDFTGETVLVFGGGSVGARKARRFAREATVVVVVSPVFPADEYGGAERIRAEPRPDEVDDWFERVDPALAVAATDDPAVNGAVESAARERNLLYNRADRPGGRDVGSVVVPATVEDGDVTVAISTGGRSPALAKELRRRIEAEIEGADELAELTAEIRQSLKDRDVEPRLRRQALRDVVQSPAVWKDLGRGASNPRQTVDAVVEAALGDQGDNRD